MASNTLVLGSKTTSSGVHCVAPGCTNYFYKDALTHLNVSFHRFPSDKQQLKRWLQSLKRTNMPNLQYGRVCSDHFMEEDFVTKGRFKDDGSFEMARTNVLKHTACPSIFNFFSSYDHTKTDCPTPRNPLLVGQRAQRRRSREAAQVRRSVTA